MRGGDFPDDLALDDALPSSDALAELRDTLGRVTAMRRRYASLQHVEIAADSPAEADRVLRLGGYPWQLATSAWGAGADHLLAWYRLVQVSWQPTSAHYTLARSAIEGAVMCRWLLDATVSSHNRRERGAIAHLEDLRNHRSFEDGAEGNVGQSSRQLSSPRLQYEELKRTLATLGIRVSRPPSMTDLCDRYLDDWVYRVLSSHAHGASWSRVTSDETGTRPWSQLPETTISYVSANDVVTSAAATYSTEALEQALADMERYLGVESQSIAPQGRDQGIADPIVGSPTTANSADQE